MRSEVNPNVKILNRSIIGTENEPKAFARERCFGIGRAGKIADQSVTLIKSLVCAKAEGESGTGATRQSGLGAQRKVSEGSGSSTIGGRVLYASGYMADAAKRSSGFLIAGVAVLGLLVLSIVGIIHAWLVTRPI
jgi:hypothetical protein